MFNARVTVVANPDPKHFCFDNKTIYHLTACKNVKMFNSNTFLLYKI